MMTHLCNLKKTINIDYLLFWLLTAFSVVALWHAPFFPSVDGIVHSHMASLLKALLIDHDPYYSRFYEINAAPIPNIVTQYILMLLQMAVSAATAERLFTTGLIILHMIALRRFFTIYAGEVTITYYAPFLFMFTYPVIQGNFNYTLSVSLALLLHEAWLSCQYRWTWQRVLAMSGATLLLYFTHLFGVALWGMLAGASICGELWEAWQGRVQLRAVTTNVAVLAGSVVLPAICLFFYVQLPKMPMTGFSVEPWRAAREILYGASFIGYSFTSIYTGITIGWTCICAALCLAYSAYVKRSPKPSFQESMLLGLALFFLTMVFFGPAQILGGWVLEVRFAHCFWICLIAYICSRLSIKHLGCMMSPVVTALVVWNVLGLYSAQPILKEMHGASVAMQPYRSVLTLNINLNKTEFPEIQAQRLATITPVMNYGAYFATEKPFLWLINYQMRERNTFPVSILHNADPLENLTQNFVRSLGEPSTYKHIDLALYRKRTGMPIDYVTIWGKEEYINDKVTKEGYRHIMVQLKCDYRPVYISPHGIMRVWEIKR